MISVMPCRRYQKHTYLFVMARDGSLLPLKTHLSFCDGTRWKPAAIIKILFFCDGTELF
ncbi:MAG: hypothetical protein LKG40_02435 [Lachnospiraceae bacterium]|nr:hypothetical protein [Lachnospiraceae bacterium]MCI1329050.1 hypothetical protein [Lachnospiraceae bacterium]